MRTACRSASRSPNKPSSRAPASYLSAASSSFIPFRASVNAKQLASRPFKSGLPNRHRPRSQPLELALGTEYKWSSENHRRRQAVFFSKPYEPIALDACKGIGRISGLLNGRIEIEHELTAGYVEHRPQGHQQILRTSLNEPAPQTHDAFSESEFTDARVAGSEHDQPRAPQL